MNEKRENRGTGQYLNAIKKGENGKKLKKT
jgi:hypothetical protein